MWPFNQIERLERAEPLDRLAGVAKPVVGRFLGNRKLRDALHGVWLGHPLHPVLVQVPVGAWTSAAILDAVPGGRRPATLLIAAGVAAALPAAAAGITDWSEQDTPQQRVGVTHALGSVAALGLYAGSLVARGTGRAGLGRALAYTGYGLAAASATVGGHLSYRQAAATNHAYPAAELTPRGWQHIGTLADLPDGRPVQRRVGEVPVFVLRTGGQVSALVDRCSHASGPLHEGKLVDHEGQRCIVCPWHGSTFRVADGSVVHGPATAPAPVFTVRIVGGQVQASLPDLAMGS
ncbi:hypothetical protein BH20ACT5_BH20ACT5_17040 [soil metagenome]